MYVYSKRRFRAPFPILYPESRQGPNPCCVDGHVGRYGRILRQVNLQSASGLSWMADFVVCWARALL